MREASDPADGRGEEELESVANVANGNVPWGQVDGTCP